MRFLAPKAAALTTSCPHILSADEEIREYLPEFIRLMRSEDSLGLSFNQVGIVKKVFVINVPGDHIRICINPEVSTYGADVEVMEGCCSYPERFLRRVRKRHAILHASTLKGEQFSVDTGDPRYSGKSSLLLSAVIQHEMDHMNGIDMRPYLT